jgi:D-alanyl-D-alanine carboxypeptidase/D-alanyl-D-alanine-endopeptidase (penicillin-binding protein 4)
VLAEHTSVALAEAIRLINKISQNLHTEMLLRTVAREVSGQGTTREGLRLAQEFFTSIGIEKGDVATYDGSGLSRRNLVTPRAVVALLTWVAKQPWAPQFVDSLPVAGQEGTLEPRMKDSPAAGRIRAKTGTLGNVNALSGFAEALHGKKLIFSMFGNSHNLRGREATAPHDAICVAMVEEIGAPPPPKPKKKK